VSNVFQLFKQAKIEEPSDSKVILILAVANILASKFELARMVKELSKHLEVLDHAIDKISDTDTRNLLKHVTKLAYERMTAAILELSREVRTLPAVQRDPSGAEPLEREGAPIFAADSFNVPALYTRSNLPGGRKAL